MFIRVIVLSISMVLTGCIGTGNWDSHGYEQKRQSEIGVKLGNVVYIKDDAGTFCGGVLLSGNRLLTAEHCFERRRDPVFAMAAGTSASPIAIGAIIARGSRLLTEFSPTTRDLALVELLQPVANAIVISRLERPLLSGEVVYAWVPQRSELGNVHLTKTVCPVLGQVGALVELDCSIKPGASGTPIFVFELGKLTLAGILTARGQDANINIAVAAHIFVLPLLL